MCVGGASFYVRVIEGHTETDTNNHMNINNENNGSSDRGSYRFSAPHCVKRFI